MKRLLRLINDTAAALIAFVIVASLTLWTMFQEYSLTPRIVAVIALFVIFVGALLWVATRSDKVKPTDWIGLSIEMLAIIGLYTLIPYEFVAILAVIWSAQMGYFLPLNVALGLSPLWSLPLWLTSEYIWGLPNAWMAALLFWSFNVFALVSIAMLRETEKSREALAHKNRELEATHKLLEEAAQRHERLRIARDIHDVMGHHLTAMGMHLQVAQRLIEDNPKLAEAITHCRQSSQQLLQDVRNTVSSLRNIEPIQLEDAIQALTGHLPTLQCTTDFIMDAPITDMRQAQTLLRFIQEALTNSVRHGQASHASITLRASSSGALARVLDNGGCGRALTPGNGLDGLKERAEALGGQVRWEYDSSAFSIECFLPTRTKEQAHVA